MHGLGGYDARPAAMSSPLQPALRHVRGWHEPTGMPSTPRSAGFGTRPRRSALAPPAGDVGLGAVQLGQAPSEQGALRFGAGEGERLAVELYLYCEDDESEAATALLLRRALGDDFRRCRIVPVGPASVVKDLGRLCAEDRLPQVGLGVLDGDEPPATGCVQLPGAGHQSGAPSRI